LVILRSCRELIDPKLKAQLVSPYTMVKLARKSRCRSVNVSIVRIVYQLNLPLIVTMTMGTLIWSVLPNMECIFVPPPNHRTSRHFSMEGFKGSL